MKETMPELTRNEIQRVHDLVRISLGTVEWIVAAAGDKSCEPPSKLLVRGLVESVLDDPGESPLIAELFTSVADTREEIGLPVGLPSPNWHAAASEIVARVCDAILTPGGKVSGVLGQATPHERTVIHVEKLTQFWPDIAAQLRPLATVRFSRLSDLLTQEFSRGVTEFSKSTSSKTHPPAKRRKRTGVTKARALISKQMEALKLHGECEGNIAEVARRMAIDRKTAEQHINAAFGKLGKSAIKPGKTKSLPTGRRGETNLSDKDDRR